jgi:hypothetical protein
MGTSTALTTAYHPQNDGQTEIMNQIFEIPLRAYIESEKNDWNKYLDGIALSYNSTPAFLLFGYQPQTMKSLSSKHNEI